MRRFSNAEGAFGQQWSTLDHETCVGHNHRVELALRLELYLRQYKGVL